MYLVWEQLAAYSYFIFGSEHQITKWLEQKGDDR